MPGLLGGVIDRTLLHGNDELFTYFNDAVNDGRLPHAHIIEGRDGSGKSTLAYAVASLMAENSSGVEYRTKVLERNCPDVTVHGLSGNSRSVGIETVRAIKEAAFIMPNELDFKMFIIEHAELMTTQAQNALLKLLEEPPREVYFMILCENTANLLATVRSRAPTLRMESFSDETLDRLLTENKKFAEVKAKNPDAYATALRLSEGNYGAAAAMLSSRSKKSDDGREVRQLISMLSGDRSQLAAYSRELGTKREELSSLMSGTTVALRDLIMAKRTSGARMMFYTDRESALIDAENFTVNELVRLYDITARLMTYVDANVNVASAALMWLSEMSGVRTM